MAHWDRPAAYLDEARRLMSLSGEDIERDEAWVLDDRVQIVGFLRVSLSGADAEIEELISTGVVRSRARAATLRACGRCGADAWS